MMIQDARDGRVWRVTTRVRELAGKNHPMVSGSVSIRLEGPNVHELFPVQSRFAPAMFRATHSAIFSRLIRTLNLRIQEILKYIRADTHTSTQQVYSMKPI